MKLIDARLCLDCDELHESERCPQCASEAFAFVTRWIPPSDDRKRSSKIAVQRTTKPETSAAR